jgi:hypothetical protein
MDKREGLVSSLVKSFGPLCEAKKIVTYLYFHYPWSRVLPEKLKVLSYSRNSPHFMEPEGSSPHSQQLATYPYPEPDRSSNAPPNPLLEAPF